MTRITVYSDNGQVLKKWEGNFEIEFVYDDIGYVSHYGGRRQSRIWNIIDLDHSTSEENYYAGCGQGGIVIVEYL